MIAASNHGPDALDPALVRPGRLGIHVEFDLPDAGERATLFGRLLAARPVEGPVDVQRLAALTRRSTPAAIVGVVDDAAGLALARGARRISADDLLAALRRGGRVDAGADADPAVRRRLAVHEAGHIAVAAALRGVPYVHSSRVETTRGRTEVGDEARRYQTVPDDELADLAVIAMAGIAAEQALLGHASLSGTDDIEQVTLTAFIRLTAGIEPRLPPVAIDDLRHYLPGSLKRAALDAIRDDLARARSLAADLVAVHAHAIEGLAEALDAAGELVGEDLARAMHSAGFVAGDRSS